MDHACTRFKCDGWRSREQDEEDTGTRAHEDRKILRLTLRVYLLKSGEAARTRRTNVVACGGAITAGGFPDLGNWRWKPSFVRGSFHRLKALLAVSPRLRVSPSSSALSSSSPSSHLSPSILALVAKRHAARKSLRTGFANTKCACAYALYPHPRKTA